MTSLYRSIGTVSVPVCHSRRGRAALGSLGRTIARTRCRITPLGHRPESDA